MVRSTGSDPSLRWQCNLDENAVYWFPAIKLRDGIDDRLRITLAAKVIRKQSDPDFFARFDLVAYVNRRCRIIANFQNSQLRPEADALQQTANPCATVGADRPGDA